jgi:flagellar basal-body rod protein FlgF/flagellar basal-body rod protein FlgG
MFKAAPGDAPQDTTKAKIAQGALEKSNVRGVVEMSRMIEITRSYTQVATLLQQQSDLSQQSVDKLADVPN